MVRILLPSLAIAFLVTACSDRTSRNHELEGTWTGVSWTVKGQASDPDPYRAVFTFSLPDRYTASFGQQQESGTYYLDRHRLYTTAEGQLEKKVGMERPDPDTLVLLMNRMGTEEVLILARQR